MNTIEADFVIVGGGSAGCVLANRLSANGQHRVVLVEAGGKPESERFRVPGLMALNIGNARFDWSYQTPADPTINGRRFDWSAGKILGGSSSLNGLVYIRGLAGDFDGWDASCGGNSGWTYREVERYFRKAEQFVDRHDDSLGSDGPLSVSSIRAPHVLQQAFLEAAWEAGYSITDLNGSNPVGFGAVETSQRHGRRAGTYECYLKPVLARPNLTVLTHAEVQRIEFDGNVATGVEVSKGRDRLRIDARRELIVAAGAIGSPALLLRSGIGDGARLGEAGVALRHHLPGVGENLQEHACAGIAKYVGVRTLNSQMGPLSGLRHLVDYYTRRSGVLAAPVVQAIGFAKSSPELAQPDIQLHFLPFGYVIGPQSRSVLTAFKPKRDAMTISVTLCSPATRGAVRLSSPTAPVVVDHRLYADPADVEAMIRGLKMAKQLYEQPSIARYVTGDCTPDEAIVDEAQWEAHLRARSTIGYHPSGSCRMGTDPMAVVDCSLRVHGLQRLRIVDASIMPKVTSGNSNATVIAIAEKAADLIQSSW